MNNTNKTFTTALCLIAVAALTAFPAAARPKAGPGHAPRRGNVCAPAPAPRHHRPVNVAPPPAPRHHHHHAPVYTPPPPPPPRHHHHHGDGFLGGLVGGLIAGTAEAIIQGVTAPATIVQQPATVVVQQPVTTTTTYTTTVPATTYTTQPTIIQSY